MYGMTGWRVNDCIKLMHWPHLKDRRIQNQQVPTTDGRNAVFEKIAFEVSRRSAFARNSRAFSRAHFANETSFDARLGVRHAHLFAPISQELNITGYSDHHSLILHKQSFKSIFISQNRKFWPDRSAPAGFECACLMCCSCCGILFF